MKTIYLLIGAKGSGKSYIGRLIEAHFGIRFLSTEKMFIGVQKSRDISDKSFLKEGYAAAEKEIDSYFKKRDEVIIESTGAFDFFDEFLNKIQSKYNVKLIYVYAPLKLCLQRIKSRDIRNHIKMSDFIIKKVYKITSSLKLDYVLKIDNSNLKDSEIIRLFQTIM